MLAYIDDLRSELKRPGQERLGVVLDIDSEVEDVPGGLQSRWDAIRNRVLQTGRTQDFPEGPQAEGTIFTVEQPDRDLRFGLWLKPDNVGPGSIEHFLLELIPEHDTLLERARACLTTVPHGERPFREIDETKAIVHTWLAWQQRPGQPMGGAISAEFFDAETELAKRFVDWVQRLFDL